MSEDNELVRSDEFTDRIAVLRQMPSETPEQKQLRNEGFMEFRANYLLDNAKLIAGATSALGEDPTMDAAELREYLQKFFVVTNPELVNAFIINIVESKDRVRKAQKLMKEEFPGSREELAPNIFRRLVENSSNFRERDMQKLPRGNVSLGAEFPLAVTLEVADPDDYKDIYPEGKGSGGFYQQSGYFVSMKHMEGHYFPLIVLKGERNKRADLHEQGHAEHKVIWYSLDWERKGERVWGWEKDRLPLNDLSNIKDGNLGIMSSGKIEELRKTKSWNVLLRWATAKAKDEILAEMSGEWGSVEGHIKGLTRRKGIYNYFDKDAGIHRNSDLSKALWNDYAPFLNKSTIHLRQLRKFYLKNKDWGKRSGLFRLVAAQIPMNEWEDKLKANGFVQEMEDYNRINAEVSDLSGRMAAFYPEQPLSKEETEIKEELADLKERFTYTVRNESDRSLIGDFRNLKTEIEELKKKAAKTPLYKSRVEYELLEAETAQLKNENQKAGDSEESDNGAKLANLYTRMFNEIRNSDIPPFNIIRKYRQQLKSLKKKEAVAVA